MLVFQSLGTLIAVVAIIIAMIAIRRTDARAREADRALVRERRIDFYLSVIRDVGELNATTDGSTESIAVEAARRDGARRRRPGRACTRRPGVNRRGARTVRIAIAEAESLSGGIPLLDQLPVDPDTGRPKRIKLV